MHQIIAVVLLGLALRGTRAAFSELGVTRSLLADDPDVVRPTYLGGRTVSRATATAIAGAFASGQGDVKSAFSLATAYTSPSGADYIAYSSASAYASAVGDGSAITQAYAAASAFSSGFASAYASALAAAFTSPGAPPLLGSAISLAGAIASATASNAGEGDTSSAAYAAAIASIIFSSLQQGGNSLEAMAVALSYAFISGDVSIAFPFAEAIISTIDRYGCDTGVNALAAAYAVALNAGRANTFVQTFSSAFASMPSINKCFPAASSTSDFAAAATTAFTQNLGQSGRRRA